jgi:hypothetical protein
VTQNSEKLLNPWKKDFNSAERIFGKFSKYDLFFFGGISKIYLLFQIFFFRKNIVFIFCQLFSQNPIFHELG